MDDGLVSEAIVAYLAKGRSSFPRTDDDAVLTMAGDVDGVRLLTRVREIVSATMAIEIDWSSHSLVESGREAERLMRERHPEIDGDAIRALSWAFTYGWR